jgi:aspartyl aminopeptidase
VPQLAIHLDRDVNDKGLVLDKQLHLSPVWGTGIPDDDEFLDEELE